MVLRICWAGFLLSVIPVWCTGQNLLSDAEWSFWVQRPAIAPEWRLEGSGEGRVLHLKSRGYESYGKWNAKAAVDPGKTYRITAEYLAQNVSSEETSVVGIVTWSKDEDGKEPVQRDYLHPEWKPGPWQTLARVLPVPAEARWMRLGLVLRWSDAGSVAFRDMSVAKTILPKARKVRVVTTHLVPPNPSTVETNMKMMLEMLDRTAAVKPDVVLFSENLVIEGVDRPLEEVAQTIPGPLTEALGERARRYQTYIVTTMVERDGGLFYNTALVIDRQGKLIGQFRKVHLAMVEGESGVTPGREYPVFDTDFGRVGVLTCWDNWFPEAARILRLNGAEMILHPLQADLDKNHWEVVQRARAIDNGVYFISSSTLGRSPSQIIDPTGTVLAQTAAPFEFVWKEIDLDETSRLKWLSVGPALGEAKSLYLRERRPDTYQQGLTGKH